MIQSHQRVAGIPIETIVSCFVNFIVMSKSQELYYISIDFIDKNKRAQHMNASCILQRSFQRLEVPRIQQNSSNSFLQGVFEGLVFPEKIFDVFLESSAFFQLIQ